MFLGKNPWHSHSIPRARVTLKAIARDPDRTLIVVDPRRSETAAMADIHLQVRPGGDAWLLAAIAAAIVEARRNRSRLRGRPHRGARRCAWRAAQRRARSRTTANGRGSLKAAGAQAVAQPVMAEAKSVASFEDLGVQMNRNSTLVSYLHRLTWMLTGNFGKEGTQYIPTPLQPLATGKTRDDRRTPVLQRAHHRRLGPLQCHCRGDPHRPSQVATGQCSSKSANPAHSLADSKQLS